MTKYILSLILVLAFSLGCIGNMDKNGAQVVFGDAMIGQNCQADGSCEEIQKSNGFTEGFMGFTTKTVELAVGMVKFFIPSGLVSTHSHD